MIYGAVSGEPTRLDAQQLLGQMQQVRGYTLFGKMAKAGEYSQELLGYFRAGKLRLPVQT